MAHAEKPLVSNGIGTHNPQTELHLLSAHYHVFSASFQTHQLLGPLLQPMPWDLVAVAKARAFLWYVPPVGVHCYWLNNNESPQN